MPQVKDQFPHYHKVVPSKNIDVYRVLSAFEVTDPTIQHAVKKLLCCGSRGLKDQNKDVDEAIASLQRYKEMRMEEQVELEKIAQRVEHEKEIGAARSRAVTSAMKRRLS